MCLVRVCSIIAALLCVVLVDFPLNIYGEITQGWGVNRHARPVCVAHIDHVPSAACTLSFSGTAMAD